MSSTVVSEASLFSSPPPAWLHVFEPGGWFCFPMIVSYQSIDLVESATPSESLSQQSRYVYDVGPCVRVCVCVCVCVHVFFWERGEGIGLA